MGEHHSKFTRPLLALLVYHHHFFPDSNINSEQLVAVLLAQQYITFSFTPLTINITGSSSSGSFSHHSSNTNSIAHSFLYIIVRRVNCCLQLFLSFFPIVKWLFLSLFSFKKRSGGSTNNTHHAHTHHGIMQFWLYPLILLPTHYDGMITGQHHNN